MQTDQLARKCMLMKIVQEDDVERGAAFIAQTSKAPLKRYSSSSSKRTRGSEVLGLASLVACRRLK
jgi:hypothetical protein